MPHLRSDWSEAQVAIAEEYAQKTFSALKAMRGVHAVRQALGKFDPSLVYPEGARDDQRAHQERLVAWSVRLFMDSCGQLEPYFFENDGVLLLGKAPGGRKVPWLTALLCAFLVGYGAPDQASRLEEEAAEAVENVGYGKHDLALAYWGLWYFSFSGPRNRFVLEFAAALLNEDVRRVVSPSFYCPALVFPVMEGLICSMRRRATCRYQAGKWWITGTVDYHDAPSLLVPGDEDPGGLSPEEVVRRCRLEALQSLDAQILLRWLVKQGHWRASTWCAEPQRVEVRGGLQELAITLGRSSSKSQGRLRDALFAFSCLEIPWPGGRTQVLREWTRRHQGRRVLHIELGDILLPRHVLSIKGSKMVVRSARRLVPFPSVIPPLVGRNNDYGPQAAMLSALLLHFRTEASVYEEQGQIEIGWDQWTEMADSVGLPLSLLEKVVDGWLHQGENDGVIEETESGSYRLACRKELELTDQFLVDAGQRVNVGRDRGRRSAEKKRRKLQRPHGTKMRERS